MFIAYQNIAVDGQQVSQPCAIASTRETFQPPMYGLRSDYEDVFAYENTLAELTAQKEAAESTLDKAAIADQLAALVNPGKTLPFVLIDRIEEHEGRAKIVDGKVLFDTDIDVAEMKALEKQYTVQVQKMLDEAAFALGYTGDNEQIAGACNSVCTYMDTGVEQFDREGRQFRRWRSAIWARGYELLDEVKAGKRAVPTPEELPGLMPKLEDFADDVAAGTQA